MKKGELIVAWGDSKFRWFPSIVCGDKGDGRLVPFILALITMASWGHLKSSG